MNAHRPYAAALAAALLALPTASLAQPKARTPASRSAPAASPVPSPPPTAPAIEPVEERGPWRSALVAGIENDSDAELKGPRLQVELERDLVGLGRRGQLSVVTAVAWFRGSRSDSVSAGGFTITTDAVENLFEVVPGFRAGYALLPRLRLFAEVGVGGGWSTVSFETKMASFPSVSSSTDAGFGVLRLAAGGSYVLNEKLRVGVLLPAWSKRYGSDGSSSTLSFSAMAAYAF